MENEITESCTPYFLCVPFSNVSIQNECHLFCICLNNFNDHLSITVFCCLFLFFLLETLLNCFKLYIQFYIYSRGCPY